MTIRKQIENIDPSAKDALFRRLLFEESLGYLRSDKTDEKSIIGFEIDLDQENLLSGYDIIAIQKHTILAYRSDLDEDKKLILFPTMQKLMDADFDLLDLVAEKKRFTDDTFEAPTISTGPIRTIAAELIPPHKNMELSEEMASSMNKTMMESTFGSHNDNHETDAQTDKPFDNDDINNVPADIPTDIPTDIPDDIPDDIVLDDEPPMDVPEFVDDQNSFDDYKPQAAYDETNFDQQSNSDNPISEPEQSKQPEQQATTSDDSSMPIVPLNARAKQINEQSFNSVAEVSDYVVISMGVNADLASNVANAALRSTPRERDQIDVAVLLFVKLFNNNKI